MEIAARAFGHATLLVLALPLLLSVWLLLRRRQAGLPRGALLLGVLLAVILGVELADRLGLGEVVAGLIFMLAGLGRG